MKFKTLKVLPFKVVYARFEQRLTLTLAPTPSYMLSVPIYFPVIH